MTETIRKGKKVVDSPEIVAEIVRAILLSYEEHEQDKEHFWTIGLNNKNVVQYVDLISIGTNNETIIHPREIFRYAILKNCNSVIVAHNHPSGVLKPSNEDIVSTRRIAEAGKIIGIELLDHVIVSADSYMSLKTEVCF